MPPISIESSLPYHIVMPVLNISLASLSASAAWGVLSGLAELAAGQGLTKPVLLSLFCMVLNAELQISPTHHFW